MWKLEFKKKKNFKGIVKNRSKVNIDGNFIVFVVGLGVIDVLLLYFLFEYYIIRNNLSLKYGVNYICYLY